jgi:hypothetical protein
MLKKNKVIPIAKASIGLKCGDCLHFKRNAKFEKKCSELGVKHFAVAPACYSPDPYILSAQAPDTLYRLGLLLTNFSAKEARVFMAILKQSGSLEKHYKLKFGQPVFFRIGNDYLSNYFRGFVLGIAEEGDAQVYVTSDMEKKQRKQPVIATLLRDSVFTVSEFKKKKQQLLDDNRKQDPNPLFAIQKIKTKMDELYVPQSLDSAPPEWFDKVEKKRPKFKNRIKEEADGTLSFKIKRAA